VKAPDAFRVVVMDVDGALMRQERLLARYRPAVLPLRDRTARLRYWCRMEEMAWLRKTFLSAVGTASGKVVFYGSGDYHHLAYLGLSLMDEPVSVIHLDNHSDFWKTPRRDTIHFGSWVARSLTLPNVRRVIQLGVDGDFDVSRKTPFPMGPVGHEMGLLHSGRIEVYPNTMRHSLLLGRVRGRLPCVAFRPGLLTSRAAWTNIRDHGGIEALLERVLPTLPTDGVCLSIDKDCLRESDNFAAYPGRQGTLALDELLAAISLIRRRKKIVFADVCGDGSRAAVEGRLFKGMVAWMKDRDIPPEALASPKNHRLNEDANLQILERLMEA